jgi:GTPase
MVEPLKDVITNESENKDQQIRKSNEIEKMEVLSIEDSSVKEVRVAIIGNVDSGKSTLVGVLTKCSLDDGRGSLRKLVFNYSHEKENGRTSSITQEIMGFKNGVQIEPDRLTEKKSTAWANITNKADKIISLIDLCGHEMYLKTTIFGLTGLLPDYALIVVGANMGVQRMTKEHLGIALALKIPIFIVVTKLDLAPDEIKKQTLDNLVKVLKCAGAQKLPIIVKEDDDLNVYSQSILSNTVCPIFCVSSTTGDGIKKLRSFMGSLKSRVEQVKLNIECNPSNTKVEYLIDSIFNVKGIGLVSSGVLISGTVKVGQTLMLGPNNKGEFKAIVVKSIHFKRIIVSEIEAGNSCCFQIKSADSKFPLKKEHIRKGMVMLEKQTEYRTVREFEAEVIILHHATTIKPKYQAVIHVGVIRQTAQVISIKDKELLRTGDKGQVVFRFINSPEYIHLGANILFREGRTRGLGQVTKLIYDK